MNEQAALDLIKRAHAHARPEDKAIRNSIVPSATLADLNVPSLAAMEMAAFVEDELDVEFPDDEMANMGSIADLIGLIRKYGGAK